jgi:alcohol dehydrogenase class IV
LAKVVFADPELTFGLPAAVTAATGMDALTHNIESYLSPAYHPLCDGIALEGTRIAAAALLTAVQQPTNLQARSDMMMSSMMGAIAFQKDLGAVHSCAHALGAVCDLHHGLANALMIDTVLAWNLAAVPAKFDELAHVCQVAGGGAAFVPWLKALKASVGITGGLAAHGVTPAHLPRLVAIATADICHQTNPRPCTAADFEALFKAAM